jgi:hypothetical protein
MTFKMTLGKIRPGTFRPKMRSGMAILDADGELHNTTLVFSGVRKTKTAPIDSLRLYTPTEVAGILAVSYDTAARRMRSMKGCIDLGSKERLHKRPKAKLRISGKHLQAYLQKRELKTE